MKTKKIAIGVFSTLLGVLPFVSLSNTSLAATANSNTPHWTAYPTPPNGFNPLKATAAQLSEYGFPAKPTDPQDLAAWTNAMSKWKGVIPQKKPILLPIKLLPVQAHAHVGNQTSAGNEIGYSSPVYAGYVDFNQTGNGFTDVHSEWNEPAISSPLQSQYANWVGFGGYSEPGTQIGSHPDLMQAGVVAYNATGTTNYTPFFQVAPLDSGVWSVNLSVSEGQEIYTDISYTTGATGGTFSYYIENLTTGQSAPGMVMNTSLYYDGTEADVITEDPTDTATGAPWKLGDFYQTSFTDSNTNNSANEPYAMLDLNNPYIVVGVYSYNSSDNNVLASPSGITNSTSFTNVWYHAD